MSEKGENIRLLGANVQRVSMGSGGGGAALIFPEKWAKKVITVVMAMGAIAAIVLLTQQSEVESLSSMATTQTNTIATGTKHKNLLVAGANQYLVSFAGSVAGDYKELTRGAMDIGDLVEDCFQSLNLPWNVTSQPERLRQIKAAIADCDVGNSAIIDKLLKLPSLRGAKSYLKDIAAGHTKLMKSRQADGEEAGLYDTTTSAKYEALITVNLKDVFKKLHDFTTVALTPSDLSRMHAIYEAAADSANTTSKSVLKQIKGFLSSTGGFPAYSTLPDPKPDAEQYFYKIADEVRIRKIKPKLLAIEKQYKKDHDAVQAMSALMEYSASGQLPETWLLSKEEQDDEAMETEEDAADVDTVTDGIGAGVAAEAAEAGNGATDGVSYDAADPAVAEQNLDTEEEAAENSIDAQDGALSTDELGADEATDLDDKLNVDLDKSLAGESPADILNETQTVDPESITEGDPELLTEGEDEAKEATDETDEQDDLAADGAENTADADALEDTTNDATGKELAADEAALKTAETKVSADSSGVRRLRTAQAEIPVETLVDASIPEL